MAKLSNQQFTSTPKLIAVAIAYTNPDHVLIADDVLPRVQVGDEDFKYQTYNEAENFTLPDTRVGRRSAPNQVEIEGDDKTSSVEDFGIDVPLDNKTIKQAEKAGWDPEAKAVGRATNIIRLDREVRVANLVQDAANYHDDHKAILAGSDQFDHADNEILNLLLTMIDECWMRPNQIVFGNNVWRVIRQDPKIVKAIHGNSGDSGAISQMQMAELLEIPRILIGSARVNISRPGEAVSITRTWGDVVAAQFIDREADNNGGITFGFTAEHGEKVAGTSDVDMGLRGGRLVRSGESVKECIVANRAGFLLEDVLGG